MSGRSYDTSKFNGEVLNYDWEDHHSPKIDILFKSWHSMYEYLLADDENVIVVHWNAGKGRTGTSISWLLIYSGLSQTAEEAIIYYGRKRFSHGKGVTQPSQIRYIKYFEKIYKGLVKSPIKRKIKSLSFKGVPFLSGYSAKMYFEIIDVGTKKTIYSSKGANMVKYEYFGEHIDRVQLYDLLPADDIDMILVGDLLFKIKNGYNNSTLCRFSVNMSFLKNIFELTKDNLDPNQFKKDTRFTEYFTMSLVTERGCSKWDVNTYFYFP